MSDSFTLKQNDRREPITRTLTDSAGAVVNLTGATIKFLMRKKRDSAAPLKVNTAATVVGDPTAGVVRYSWAAADTDTPGSYKGEFEVTFGDGTKQSFPNDEYILVLIIPEVG